VPGLSVQPNHPKRFAGSIKAKYDFGPVLADLHDFHAAGCQQHNLPHRIALKVNCLAARVHFLTRCGHDFSAIPRRNITE
jgi:hypothetical protein